MKISKRKAIEFRLAFRLGRLSALRGGYHRPVEGKNEWTHRAFAKGFNKGRRFYLEYRPDDWYPPMGEGRWTRWPSA